MGVQESFTPDFTKPAKEILIDLINFANRTCMTTKLHTDTCFFTRPIWLPKGSDVNTAIRFAKVEGFKIPQGTEEIQYNRLDINQIALSMPWDFVLYIDEKKHYKTTHDILDELFEVFPIRLTKEDVVEEEINFELDKLGVFHDDIIDGYREGLVKNKVTLTISDDSIGYYGSLTFRVFPKPINIDVAVRHRKFKGFTYVPTWGLS